MTLNRFLIDRSSLANSRFMTQKCKAVALSILLILCVGRAASAQSVTIGYQLVHIPDETFPLGFNADVAVPLAQGLSAVGEAGFAHDNENRTSTSITISNFGGGVRWSSTNTYGAAGAFLQLIVGGVHTSANVTNNGVTSPADDTAFMLQPGIGIVAPARGAVRAVVQGDYRRAFFKEEAENEVRLFVGVRIGSR